MIRYYVRLSRQVPRILWNAADHTIAVVAVIVLAAALFNRPLAQAIGDWDGFSPWWAALLIGLLFAYGLARANYVIVADAEAKALQQEATAAALRQKEQLVELQNERIEELQRAFNLSQAQYKVLHDFQREFKDRLG